MTIQVNAGEFPTTPAVVSFTEEEVQRALERFASQVTRVEVHLRDLNGPQSGVDKRCTMEVRLAGQQPLAVDSDSGDLYEAIRTTAGKLHRAVERKLGKLRKH